jgi:hypothetical protein
LLACRIADNPRISRTFHGSAGLQAAAPTSGQMIATQPGGDGIRVNGGCVRHSRLLFRNIFLASALVLGMSTVGHAEGWGNNDWWHKKEPPHEGGGGGGKDGPPRPAPEIDPASASAALAMLAGGILVIRGRR